MKVWQKSREDEVQLHKVFVLLQQKVTLSHTHLRLLTLLVFFGCCMIPRQIALAQVCPFSDYGIGNVESLCGGELPDLPLADFDFTLDDPDGTQVGIMQWFQDETPDNGNTYDLQPVFHSGNNICQPDPVKTFYAYVRCDSDLDGEGDEWVLVAQHTFQIYPDAQAPVIIQNDNTCTYSVEPACENDQINPDTFASLSPGTSEGSIEISVVPTSPICPTQTFIVTYPACDLQACVSSDFVDAGIIPLCEGDIPSLPLEGIDFTLSNTATQMGTVEWYDEIASPYTPEPVVHLGNPCLPNEVMMLIGLVGCDSNLDGTMDELVVVASYQFQVYPTPQTPSLERIDETCNYEIVPVCETDIFLPNTVPTQSPGSGGGFHSVNVSSGLLNSPCSSFDFDISYPSCPVGDCPTVGFFQPMQESLCNGETPNLPLEGIDFTINDSDGTQNGDIVWFDGINPNTANVFTPTSVFHSGNDFCAPDEWQTVYAFVQCDTDADENTDFWIQAATHQFRVFPDVQTPSIQQIDLTCNYIIIPFCDDDQANRSDFQLLPGSAETIVSVSMTSGITGTDCIAQNFDLLASSCPLPDNAFVAPNSFSPNGDGRNDEFRIVGANIVEVDLHIYNRWGESIYTIKGDENTAWNGVQNDQTLADVGIYAFYALVTFIDGDVELARGGINLVR